MVAGPCCVFGATATDAPPDVVVGEGAASDGVASFDHFEEERGGTSSSEDDEELKITAPIELNSPYMCETPNGIVYAMMLSTTLKPYLL